MPQDNVTPEQAQESIRVLGARFDEVIAKMQGFYTMKEPPYRDEKGRFRMDYRMWTPESLEIMEMPALAGLHIFSANNDHARLSKILPDYYRSHGGVVAFDNDITRIANSRGHYYNFDAKMLEAEKVKSNRTPVSSLDSAVGQIGLNLVTPIELTDRNPQTPEMQALAVQLRNSAVLAA